MPLVDEPGPGQSEIEGPGLSEAALTYEQELRTAEQERQNGPVPNGQVDAAAFVKAQSEFLRIQTWFLTHGSEKGSLVKYSLAQGAFIEAQRVMLEQLGVV